MERAVKINYVAVLVCAVLYFLLGWLWFGVLFSQRWMALEGITMTPGKAAAEQYVTSFLLGLLMAYVLANVCAWRNANSASRGAALGVLLWIGFIGPVTFTTNMYEGRPNMLFAINNFYPLVGLWMMGIVLGMWRKKPA
jgi:surface polysaccharide O-acyltransferase-like enzyme